MVVGWSCVTSAKYDQVATLLRQGYSPEIDTNDPNEGHYVYEQHPITGEVVRRWVEVPLPDDPDTGIDESTNVLTFRCQARGIITGGLNSQGTTERWTSKGTYENIDYIEMQVPKGVTITKRDRVTNITNSRGEVVWREEEFGRNTPTIFDVRGVTPSLDPFGHLVEWFVLLERSEIQTLSGQEERGTGEQNSG